MKIREDEKGFTLVELLVVIAILGLLVTLGVPKYRDIKDKAVVNVDKSNRAILTSCANIALAENGNPKLEIVWEVGSDGEVKEISNSDYNPKKYIESWPKYPRETGENYKLTIDTLGKIKITPDLKLEPGS